MPYIPRRHSEFWHTKVLLKHVPCPTHKCTHRDCTAWPKKLCDYFDHGALTSAVLAAAIFAGLIPALSCGILLLLRTELECSNDRYMLDYTESQVRMQLARLMNAEPPTCPLDMLERLLDRLDRVGMRQ